MSVISSSRLESAFQIALDALLNERHPDGHWVGELSTSALSTATAIMALQLTRASAPAEHDRLIAKGVNWLVAHQNSDGGWGDTTKSISNISTTMLCQAALHITGAAKRFNDELHHCEGWLAERFGRTPEELAEAVRSRYGADRTFAVPILTTCALAGLVNWCEVPVLPFELACLPHSWFRVLRLHVVSYALPALIGIGQCIHHHRPSWNPITRIIRWLAGKRSLSVLDRIQPANGGFLEATPLTSFVTISLAAIGKTDHPVTKKGIEFIINSVRGDGSWPIDTNLSTWVTTMSVNALAAAGELQQLEMKDRLIDWLIHQQYKNRHPYTDAAPGGWAWTPLPGGVPDADDTPGALLALVNLGCTDKEAFRLGFDWLAGLQNRDKGIPTFCRGWGQLPFDRSGSDLTAHVLRAFAHCRQSRASDVDGFADTVVSGGLSYLERQQRPDGSWLPLWFGNQHAPNDENPAYGSARVLAAYQALDMMNTEPARRGVAWLADSQNTDGGWGGCKGTPSSIEETALALEALLGVAGSADAGSDLMSIVNNGIKWLVEQVEAGGLNNPTPIGFYFAKLWYYEKLYPIIFTVAALGKARRRTQPLLDPRV